MTNKRILVIDDDRTILEMLGLALSKAGYDVLSATDGDDGIRLYKDENPDLALIDIAMPGIDGYEVVERIRKLEDADSHTPLIILTAHDQTVMRTYAQELGADLYLVKPVTPTDLVKHIEDMLNKE